jgi:hypothetical protein
MIIREKDLCDAARRKKTRHPAFHQSTDREKINRGRGSIETATKSEDNNSITKRKLKFHVASP